jgi:DNA-binding transcriptional LysR family regulator
MLARERMQAESTVEPAPASPPPRRALPPFESLRAFDAIARFGGVRRAAEHLNRDHAVVSRHLRTIEEWTGTKLMKRTPNGASLTEDGARYHRQIASAIESIASATLKVMRKDDKRRLCIRCMPELALNWLSARLIDFERDNSDIDVEVCPTERSVDGLDNYSDIELRFVTDDGDPAVTRAGYRTLDVARAAVIGVASREYLSRVVPIRSPRDLLTHQLLREESHDRWRDWLAAHGVTDDLELSGPRLWHGPLALEAARRGRGIALTDELTVASDLKEGRLVAIGRGSARFASSVSGTWQFVASADRWETGQIARFRGWLLSTLGKEYPHLRTRLPRQFGTIVGGGVVHESGRGA